MSKLSNIILIFGGCIVFALVGHFVAKEKYYNNNTYTITTKYTVRVVGEDKNSHLIVFNERTANREFSNVVGSEDNIGQYLYAIKTDVFDVKGNMIRSDTDYRFGD